MIVLVALDIMDFLVIQMIADLNLTAARTVFAQSLSFVLVSLVTKD